MLTIKDALLAIRRAADREKDYDIVSWCNFALADAEVIDSRLHALALLSRQHIITNSAELSEAIEKGGAAVLMTEAEIDNVHR